MPNTPWRVTVFWWGKKLYYSVFPARKNEDSLGIPDKGKLLFSIMVEGGTASENIELIEELGNREVRSRRLILDINVYGRKRA